MTAIQRIRVKIERAKEHMRDLRAETSSFLQGQPYAITTRRDPESRRLIYYASGVRDTPSKIASVAGDVLQNLRSSLDHLAYELFMSSTKGTQGDGKHVAFPIFDDVATYRAQNPGKLRGFRQDAIDAINATRPYKGGNDILWRIHRLNNIDKHRCLITVGSAYRSLNLAKAIESHAHKSWPANLGPPIPCPDFFVRPSERLFPLKAGDELFVDAPDAEIIPKMEFRFEVAFGETSILEGESLFETLEEMIEVVEKLLSSFESLL